MTRYALFVTCVCLVLTVQPTESLANAYHYVFNVGGVSVNPNTTDINAPANIEIYGFNPIRFNRAAVIPSTTVTAPSVSVGDLASIITPTTTSATSSPNLSPQLTKLSTNFNFNYEQVQGIINLGARQKLTSTQESAAAQAFKTLKIEVDKLDQGLGEYGLLADTVGREVIAITSVDQAKTLSLEIQPKVDALRKDLSFTSPVADDATASNILIAAAKASDVDPKEVAALQDRLQGDKGQPISRKLEYQQLILDRLSELSYADFYYTNSFPCGWDQTSTKLNITEIPVINVINAKTETISIECSKPFSLSTGLGLSFVKNQQIGFVSSSPNLAPTPPPSSGTPPPFVNRFEYTVNQTSQIVIPALINVRFDDEGPAGQYYLTVGAIGGGAGGYVGGFSYGRGWVLFTVAGQFSTQQTLSGGYNIGDIVPPNLASAPTTKTSANSIFIGITFPVASFSSGGNANQGTSPQGVGNNGSNNSKTSGSTAKPTSSK